MKRTISLLLSLIIIVALFTACGGDGHQEDAGSIETTTQPALSPDAPLSDGKTLKMLAIGNSFSDNTVQYLYDVAKAEGMTDILIARLYIGGCSLAMHVENAETNAPAYSYYKNDSGMWKETEAASLLYALQDEQWDIITMQQASGSSGKAETYRASIDQLVKYVNENKTNPNARLVWHMTWAYQQGSTNKAFAGYNEDQMTMYNAITEAVQQVIEPMPEFHSVIPVGTAIQNARTSFIGDELTRDTYHLNDLGKVIGSYTWYAAFTGKPLEAVHISGVGSITLTDEEKAVIVEAVNAALETPYQVTESNHK